MQNYYTQPYTPQTYENIFSNELTVFKLELKIAKLEDKVAKFNELENKVLKLTEHIDTMNTKFAMLSDFIDLSPENQLEHMAKIKDIIQNKSV